MVDLSVCRRVQRSIKVHTFLYTPRGSEVQISLRGPDIQNRLKKYPTIDYRAFAFSRRRYATANRSERDIPHSGPFWVVKIQGGGNAPSPPDKNIPGERGTESKSGREREREKRETGRGEERER